MIDNNFSYLADTMNVRFCGRNSPVPCLGCIVAPLRRGTGGANAAGLVNGKLLPPAAPE